MEELSADARRTVEAAMQLAVQRHQAGDVAAAEALYGKVLTANAAHAGALHNLGLIRLARGDVAAALVLLGAAVEQRPQEPVFQFNLGLARQSAGELPGAAAAYREALRCRPDYRKAWENLGVVLQDLEQPAGAIDAYQQALTLDRHSPVAQQNLGNALRATGRTEEALAQYRAALDLDPLNADLAAQYGGTLLSSGDVSGWDWYEWRYWSPESLQGNAPYHVALPKWDGGALAGRELLLYGEQGVGDEVMFASCIPAVVARGAKVTLLCEPRLAPLFARSFADVNVQAKPRGGLPPLLATRDEGALRCSLASLPQRLRRTAANFSGTAWLRADAEATARWRQRLATPGKRITIGLSWRGGAATRAREARSIALERLAPLFASADASVVDLQYGDHQAEISRFNSTAANPLLSFEDVDPLRDLDGFAALLSALDLVISVDNSTAHLAGALGVPTWLMLPYQADWRWRRGSVESEWYRSLRLFWQAEPGTEAWTGVIAYVRDELRHVQPTSQLREAPGEISTTASATTGTASLSPAAAPLPASADVLLLNDTTYWYHFGCACTSLALHEELRARGLIVDAVPITHINALSPLPSTAAELDDEHLFQAFCSRNPGLIERMQSVGSVIVNGEGSIHDLGQTARALLYLTYIARQRFGRHTRIVNHSGYPTADGRSSEAIDALYRKVYSSVDFVAVREDSSATRLAQLGIQTTPAFDCLPLFVARHPPAARVSAQRRVVIAGSVQHGPALFALLAALIRHLHQAGHRVEILVGANAWLAQDDVLLLQALHERIGADCTLVAATSESEWLATIAGAALLISGRFHHSIAAACLGTPLLLMASNTRKNDGLLQRLGLEKEQVWLSPDDPATAHQRVQAMLDDPRRGLVTPATISALQELARRNFQGLPERT